MAYQQFGIYIPNTSRRPKESARAWFRRKLRNPPQLIDMETGEVIDDLIELRYVCASKIEFDVTVIDD